MKYYLRNEIAKKADINIETLRYYENNNLIPIPKRDANGYRIYSEDVLIILAFIKDAKSVGFTLKQIKQLFLAINGENIDLEYVDKFIDEKTIEVEEKINYLRKVEEQLQSVKKNLYTPHECPLCNAFRRNSEE